MIGGLRKQTISRAKALAGEVVIPEAQRLIEDSGFVSGPVSQKELVAGGTIKRLPPPKPRPTRTLTAEERQETLREADASQRFQRQMEEAQLLAELSEMSEADRYGRLLEMEMGGSSTLEGPRGGVPLSFIPEPVWVLRRRLFVRPA